MASTSTNKQPLLVDSPLHVAVDLSGRFVGDVTIDVGEGNRAVLMVDCTQNDGAIIEDVYSFSRKIQDPIELPYQINLYMCPNNVVMDPATAFFIGAFISGEKEAQRSYFQNFPRVLAPVARVGSEEDTLVEPTYFRALYLPKGQCLWAAAVKQFPDDTAMFAPIVMAQGGYY